MPVYLEVFHGRKDPDEELHDWGSHGPVIGPLQYVQFTYGMPPRLGPIDYPHDSEEMTMVEDMLYYDGVYYGDFSIISEDLVQKEKELHVRVEPFDPSKATLAHDGESRALLSGTDSAKS
jgi:hypothetical protein